MQGRRVVVTGLGVVSPVGSSVASAWAALIAGESGIGPIQTFDARDMPVRIAGHVRGFDPDAWVSPRDQRRLGQFVVYALAASKQALADAGLDPTHFDEQAAERVGALIGSGIGGLPEIEAAHATLCDAGARRISPFFVPGAIVNMAAGQLSIMLGMRGPNAALVSACASGTHAIGQAARMIAYGDADVMVAGGAEMASSPLGIAGFAAARALSVRNDEPERASRPWDRARDGFVLADGAGIVVLESEDHARARGARIYCELAGFGWNADAHHMTQPSPGGAGAAACMRRALADAGVNPDEVGYINAHGTSTPAGDRAETDAVKRVFGEAAYRIAVNSTKSMTGHLLGAAGGVEAVFATLALYHQVSPPTINLDDPDDGCDLDYVAHVARDIKTQVALSNSFGFGGTNGTLVFRRLGG